MIDNSKFTSKSSTLKQIKYQFVSDVASGVFRLTKDHIANIVSMEHMLVTKSIVLSNIEDNTHSLGVEENVL